MEKNKLQIRVATKEDAEALLAIYAPYVEETAITFEYEVPSIEAYPEFKRLHRLSGNRGRASEQRQRTLPYTPWLPDGWGVLPVRV